MIKQLAIETIFSMRSAVKVIQNFDKNIDIFIDVVLTDFFEDKVDEDDWLEISSYDANYEYAGEGDYEDISSRVEEYFEEINEFISGAKTPESFILDWESGNNRYMTAVPNEYMDEIAEFLDEFGFSYAINDEYGKDADDIIDEIETDFRDAAEYEKDPLGYYGMSQRDFM